MSSKTSSKKNVNDSFNLAVKYFMNKNFHLSFDIITDLYENSFNQFNTGVIPELLFCKIVNLFIVESGLILDTKQKEISIKLANSEKEHISKVIYKQIDQDLINAFGNLSAIPPEIIYNLYKVRFINRESLSIREQSFVDEIKRIVYSTQDQHPDSVFTKKISDFYVFELLPEFKKFEESEVFIDQSLTYGEQDLIKLTQIKQEIQKRDEEIHRSKQDKLNREKELERLQQQQKKEEKKEENLTYKTLKQIRNQALLESETQASSSSSTPKKSGTDIAVLKQRLFYQLKFLRGYFLDNYPVILTVLISILIGARYIKKNNVNIKEKIIETMKMALKVTYL